MVVVHGRFPCTIWGNQIITKVKTMTDTNKTKAQEFKQQVGLSRAQDARRLMKISPRERHHAKVLQALRWTHGWGQTTQKLLLAACGVTKADFLTKLREHGYMRMEYVIGRTFWLLNKSGVDLLRSMCNKDDELAKLSGTRHPNLYAFSHNMYVQAVLAHKLRQGGHDCQWWCDRQLRASLTPSEPGSKSPDGAFKDSAGFTTYIEVERSAKRQPELEVMLLNLARLLEKDKKSCAEIYLAEGIQTRYKSTLGQWLANGTFRAWSQSTEGDLFESGIYQIPEPLGDAFRRITLIPTKIPS